MSIEAAYFNEALTVWEPLIELCETDNDYFKQWEVMLNVRCHFFERIFIIIFNFKDTRN
jgi:hypothetical protein